MISCNGHIKYSTHKIIKRRDIFNNSFFAAILLVLRINDTLLNAYIEQSLSLLKYLDVNNHPDTCSTHWAAVMLYKKLASSTRLPRFLRSKSLSSLSWTYPDYDLPDPHLN